MKKIVLGTRGSKLALWQTEFVAGLLESVAPEYSFEVKVIKTKGDKILDVALSKIGDKGLFTKELERALLEGEVDVCVHSMKDVPTLQPEGLACVGVPLRANPCDALVSLTPGATLESLPAGSRVATGSLRRVAQLLRLRPDITPCEIRGNIDTRIGRVVSGDFDAAILAASGMERLGVTEHMQSIIPASTMIPAVGQGALAIEARADDEFIKGLCREISDPTTQRAVEAERWVLAALEGGCQVPLGAHAIEITEADGTRALQVDAFVASLDGKRFMRATKSAPLDRSLDAAKAAVEDLLAQGAEEILEELR